MDNLTLILISALNIVCFFTGAKVGQKVVRNEALETPNINPMKAYREKQSKKAAQEEQDKIDAIMRNIERYDGSAKGQEDIP
jgi:uncharacterized protein YneF (UPF0154 family)